MVDSKDAIVTGTAGTSKAVAGMTAKELQDYITMKDVRHKQEMKHLRALLRVLLDQ